MAKTKYDTNIKHYLYLYILLIFCKTVSLDAYLWFAIFIVSGLDINLLRLEFWVNIFMLTIHIFFIKIRETKMSAIIQTPCHVTHTISKLICTYTFYMESVFLKRHSAHSKQLAGKVENSFHIRHSIHHILLLRKCRWNHIILSFKFAELFSYVNIIMQPAPREHLLNWWWMIYISMHL